MMEADKFMEGIIQSRLCVSRDQTLRKNLSFVKSELC